MLRHMSTILALAAGLPERNAPARRSAARTNFQRHTSGTRNQHGAVELSPAADGPVSARNEGRFGGCAGAERDPPLAIGKPVATGIRNPPIRRPVQEREAPLGARNDEGH